MHRLNGISSPANAQYSAGELAYQLDTSQSKAIFTCLPLLPVALEAAKKVGISKENVFLLPLPKQFAQGAEMPKDFLTVEDLVQEGQKLPSLPVLKWEKGQGAQQIAFLCYSSGTSGLPKGVMISHRNVISNTLQLSTFEMPNMKQIREEKGADYKEVVLGLLPFSHIYGLIAVVHKSVYEGSKLVVLPKYEMKSYLQAIQDHRIEMLYIVGPCTLAELPDQSLTDNRIFPGSSDYYSHGQKQEPSSEI